MITRRTFVHRAGSLVPLAFLTAAQPRSYKLGLQLYTLRAAMAAGADDTLTRVADIGYEEVETYGFDPASLQYYGLPAKDFAQRLRDRQLSTPSGHYDLNRFMASDRDALVRYVDRCIEGAAALGQAYITWPLLDKGDRTPDRFKEAAQRLNVAGERIREAGLQLAYHNHDFEFVDHGGRLGYDIILGETDPELVKLQMDLYWMARASQAPRTWFKKQPGRFVMWHVKDVHKVNGGYTEVGNGTIDFTEIWPDAALAGLQHFFVEQGGNFTHDPIRSVTDSAAYVRRVLMK